MTLPIGSLAPRRLALLTGATLLLLGRHGYAAEAGADVPPTEQLTVTGVLRPYAASTASSATKSDIPVLETPRAVSTVTRQLLDDQGAITVEDALKNVAGVIPGGYYSDWDYFRIRGFEANSSTYIDGLLHDAGGSEETFGLERIEVVKGPISGLYGSGPPGGLVNLISKKPPPEDFANLSMTVGSYGDYEPTLDAGGRLNAGGTVYGRVELLYRNRDSYVDYAGDQRVYVAPSLTWEISSRTKVTFLARYQWDEVQHAFPLPAAGTVLPNINGPIPIGRYVGEPDHPNTLFDRYEQLGYTLEHRFNDVLTAHQTVRLGSYTSRWENMLYPDYLASDQRTLYRYPYDANDFNRSARVDSALEANFVTGPVAHTLIAGVDYGYTFDRFTSRTIDFSDPSQLTAIDIYNPVYGSPLPTVGAPSVSRTTTGQTGLYLQEHAKLTDRLTMTLGGRFDYATIDGGNSGDTARHFSPEAGATYALTPTFAAYVNYAGSFNPQSSSQSFGGGTLTPETGDSWEAGVKLDALEHRATALISIYQLTRQNVATSDPLHPDFYITAGEQRSKGIELEGTYQPVAGLLLTAAYAYVDARVTRDNSLLVGAPLINVPHNSVSTWIKYMFQDGPLKDFGVGLGARYYTKQAGVQVYASNPGEAFSLPGYGVADAALYYDRGPWSAQLNVKNFTDERYFAGSYNEYYVQPGEPLTALFTVTRHF